MASAIPQTFSGSAQGHMSGNVLVLELSRPGLAAAAEDICRMLELAAREAGVHGIVIKLAGGAVADPAAQAVFARSAALLEAFEKPVVAALEGSVSGPLLELALAAHARIASADARLAFPQVRLGIVPSAGGTQRLPRLIGAPQALAMIAGARVLAAAQALEAGLIDRIAGNDLLAQAQDLLATLAPPLRRASALAVADYDADAFDAEASKIVRKGRGAMAPAEAVRLVRLASEAAVEAGLAEEAQVFRRLHGGAEAAALRHLAEAEERAAWTADGMAAPVALSVVGVAGLGLMGAGIAAACLAAGYRVVGFEQTAAAAEAGRDRIAELLAKAVAAGKLGEDAAATQIARLSTATDIAGLADADLVIEAVFDDFDVKAALFRALDPILKPGALLATNTSYLDPDALAAVTTRPDRVLGLHFFSPANIMRLVEVVDGEGTSEVTLATGIAFVRRLGKLPVVTGVGEGFIGNHIFSAYRGEAEAMLAEGAYPEDIDRAVEAYGFPLGIFALNDMTGLEISWARRKRAAATRDPHLPYIDIADKLCEAGRFGRKTGRGWYVYEDGKRRSDPQVHALIEDYRARKGIAPKRFGEAQIMDRLLAVMAREGHALIGKGVARRTSDIDLVLVNGYGFPANKGGPMFASGK